MNNPPVALVKTWYELLKTAPTEEAKSRAQEMLLGAFGSYEGVAAYLKKNNLM